MDRRTFIRLVAGSAACSFVGGAVPAGAEELEDNFTPFSPELAAEMASAFFEGAGGLSSCVCSERQSVVMLAINEGTASAPKRAGHAGCFWVWKDNQGINVAQLHRRSRRVE